MSGCTDTNVKPSNVNDFIQLIQQLLNILDEYEPSRAFSIAFTRLEEATLWAQVGFATAVPKAAADQVATCAA